MTKIEIVENFIVKNRLDGSGRLLDIGCGSGEIAARIEETYGIKCFGIDTDAEKIKVGIRRSPRALLSVGDAECLPFYPETFDGILCLDTLSSVNMQEEAVFQAKTVLKKGGVLCIADSFIANDESDQLKNEIEKAIMIEADAMKNGTCSSRKNKRPTLYGIGGSFSEKLLTELLVKHGFTISYTEMINSSENLKYGVIWAVK